MSSANFVTSISRVCELMSPLGGWNVNLIETLFDSTDAAAILELPVSTEGAQDRKVWQYTKSGSFTVKSAYREEMNAVNASRIDRLAIPKELWKSIWKSNLPEKAKVHIWRCCREILPTRTRLLSKFVWIENGCPLCGELVETINHAMRDCAYMARLRERIPHLLSGLSSVSIFNPMSLWLLQCLEELPIEVFEALLYFMWSTWKERNDRIFNEKFLSVNALFMQGWSSLQAFRAVQVKAKQIPRQRDADAPWSCPGSGWLKANVGVTYDPSIDQCGFGIVVRDSSGECVGGMTKTVEHASSWQKSRALAVKEALSFCISQHLTPVIFEVDSKALVSGIAAGRNCSNLGPIIEDIQVLVGRATGSVIKFVKHNVNKHAVRLARIALSFSYDLEWIGIPPPQLEGIQLSLYTN